MSVCRCEMLLKQVQNDKKYNHKNQKITLKSQFRQKIDCFALLAKTVEKMQRQ